MTLAVERAGLLTTVQDGGRWGFQHLGVPVSGWMDDWSARLANRLAGNTDGEALLEVTWLGPTLRAECDLQIAVTGAIFDVVVDGVRTRTPLACHLREGAAIEFGQRHAGTRAYLAVRGGIALAPILGSRSTDVRSGLGGVNGRRLERGDRVPTISARLDDGELRTYAPSGWLGVSALRVMPVTPPPCCPRDIFTEVCNARYRLAAASDRTGYRLMADRPLPETPAGLISQPVVTGAVQLPPGGSPLLLMADRQTTGGYAVVAVVVSADLPLAGQLAPGDACTFEPCSLEQARAAAAEREQALDAVAARVA